MSEAVTRLNTALEGRYEIERELGEGGMATVYLAKDLKHSRHVALKVLKPELAAVVGAERFLAEIETTANLQHPHILPLFDSGEADTFLFYVMPYVEGETLRERIDRDRQLPVEEAVGIATAIANALHTAHEQGVVHRDIKPGNILMSRGEALVADFGIALAVSAGGAGRLTETGLSLGTPYYMSPEQATGDQAVGPASDTFALACVLYEMLVGEPPYPGNTAQAVLGKIIQGAPVSATAIRKSIPANVDAAIRRALEKLPADRFKGAQDFAKALADPGFGHAEAVGAGRGGSGAAWKWVAIVFATLFSVTAIGLGRSYLSPEPPQPVAQFESPFREGQEPLAANTSAFNLSPDGSTLVYTGPSEQAPWQLWMRRWDDPDASPIRGTEVGIRPAISPDGRQLAFAQDGEIKVLFFEGGPVQTLADGSWPRWGPDGYIYFQADGSLRVPVTGGPPEPVTQLAEGEQGTFVADFLPGGSAALAHVVLETGDWEVRTMSLATGEMERVTPGQWPRYAASGHLTFLSTEGTLMAAPFDPRSMVITGPSVSIIEGVAQYALSTTGDLVYTRATEAAESEFVWLTRSGQATVVDPGMTFDRGVTADNAGWRLSPDNSRVVFAQTVDGNNDIWIKELPAGPESRLTFHEARDELPRWSPDGRSVIFRSERIEQTETRMGQLMTRRSDGTGDAEVLFDDFNVANGFWSPAGEWLVIRRAGLSTIGNAAARDILALRPGTDDAAIPLIATDEFWEQGPAISPDGQWLAYSSNETGRQEVFVRPFPNVDGGKWQVSTGGGALPEWAHTGRELFFVNVQDRELIVAEYEAESTFRVVGLETLFTIPQGVHLTENGDFYDVAADDQRFLMARSTADPMGATGRYVLIQNWFEELKARVPN